MFKIADRYIFRELVEPFVFGLGAFTAILSSSMILFELVRAVVLKGMPLIVAGQIFVYRLPGIVVYIFPMATLLAALLAFSRLSNDSEIIAFRASGISLYRLIIPVIVLGLIVSFTNLAFSEIVVPEANRAANNLLIDTTAKKQPKLQNNIFVPELEHGVLKRIFYVEKLKDGIMHNVIVQEYSEGQLAQIIVAKSGQWDKDKNTWVFKDGIMYPIGPAGDFKHLIKFKEQVIAIKYSPADFYLGDKNPDDMTIKELKGFIALKQRRGEDVTDYNIQADMKMAIPFASLVFALLGAPLGLSPKRASSSIGLGLSIIVIFLYYILTFISMSLGELKIISPLVAAWLPNIITAFFGIYILYRASKR